MKERGFTLVEVMIAVVIGAVLLVIAGNWFMTQTQAYRYLNAQGLFRIALHLARERAMTERSSVPLASVRKGTDPNTLIFTVGVDPDSYAGSTPPSTPPGGYRSGMVNGKPYRVLMQALMPSDPTSADGKAAMSNSDFWSLNDRICEVTGITTTGPSGSDEIACRCPSTVKTSKYVDLSTLSISTWPLPLAQSAKARSAVLVNIIPAVPGSTGTVIDSTTGERMGSNDFAVLKDRGTVLEYYFNTQRLQRVVTSPITVAAADTTSSYGVVFNQLGGTLDGALYVVTFSWIESGGSVPRGGARFRILPSGEVR